MFRGNLINILGFTQSLLHSKGLFLFAFCQRVSIFPNVKRFPFEALFWLAGLVILATLNPGISHFSICPLKNVGLNFCPGCGLGTSISLFFRGQIWESVTTHPLGIFAVIVLSFRIINLIKLYLRYGKSY